jgi:hypothetical protein
MNRHINLYGKVALCALLLSLSQFINNNNKFQKDDRIHTENFQSIHNTKSLSIQNFFIQNDIKLNGIKI